MALLTVPEMTQIDEEASAQTGYPSTYLLAQQYAESWNGTAFNTDAVSPTGAVGVSQFEPATAQEWGVDPTNPLSSAIGQAKYMMYLGNQNKGNFTAALNQYNGNTFGSAQSPYSSEIEGKIDELTAGGLQDNFTSPTATTTNTPASAKKTTAITGQGLGWSVLGIFISLIFVVIGARLLISSLASSSSTTLQPARAAAQFVQSSSKSAKAKRSKASDAKARAKAKSKAAKTKSSSSKMVEKTETAATNVVEKDPEVLAA